MVKIQWTKIIIILHFVLACSVLRDEKRGIAIHTELSSSSSDMQHVRLQNALIDFYSKINRIETAEKMFKEMNLLWNRYI